MAIGAVRALNEADIRYPDQIAVMSFDDMESFELLRPGLTAIAQPAYEMGARAASLLLERIAGTLAGDYRRVLLPVHLRSRGSSALPDSHPQPNQASAQAR
jgi:DNA-binding LacI/PurR family transcriptional regulator